MGFAARYIEDDLQNSFPLYNESQEPNVTPTPNGSIHTEGQPTYTRYIFIAIYCLIFLLGLFPNIIVTYILFTRKYMRLKYIFTASISIAHVTFCCICIPIIIYEIIYDHSTAGTVLCQVVVCLTFSATSLSMLSTAVRRSLAMSERYRYATFTYRGKVKNIVAIWLFSLLISLPYICTKHDDLSPFDITNTNEMDKLENDTQSDNSGYQRNLSERHPLDYPLINITNKTNATLNGYGSDTDAPTRSCIIDMNLYTTCMVVALLFISVLISLVLQTLTMKAIKRRPNQVHWIKEIQITKQHILMLTIFLICWAPLCIVCNVMRKQCLTEWLLTVFNILAASNVIYNPFLYYVLNSHIRHELELWIRNVINLCCVGQGQ